MLVKRHTLSGRLSADPSGLLGQDDTEAHARDRKRRGYSAEAATDDEHVRFQLVCCGSRLCAKRTGLHGGELRQCRD